MVKVRNIVRLALLPLTAAVLSACGQTGDLYLPTEPGAAQRARLHELIIPGLKRSNPAAVADTEPAPPPVPTEADRIQSTIPSNPGL